MHLDERHKSVTNRLVLHQRHFAVVGKEFELGNRLVGFLVERLLQILLAERVRNVRDVQRLRGWVDVVEVLRPGSFEPMQRTILIISGEARVLG